MDLREFTASLAAADPPSGLDSALDAALIALWWDEKGDWEKAHRCVDELEDPSSMSVHAYLHRKEGDEGNAAYWYRRAGRPISTLPLADEARALLTELLGGAA